MGIIIVIVMIIVVIIVRISVIPVQSRVEEVSLNASFNV